MSEKTAVKTLSFWDRAGVALSSVCMIHCVLMPIICLLAPLGLGIIEHDHFHSWIFWPVFGVAFIAFGRGYWASRNLKTLLTGVIGLMSLISAHNLGHALGHEHWEYLFSFLGSSLLITAHIRNLRALTHYSHHPGQRLDPSKPAPSCCGGH